ncbi:intracellular protein transport protein USO1-like [Strongylocentrotus purpuratus]|uniref:B box-type domain-containing protein n=1 Tax=Strongylocentrotus purpuratus TaxID=7668 RepID=A0A7M7PFL5_STRPU|nr:intracellular protein transport protein USO1-like [Strongylocentrotus purpuratus]
MAANFSSAENICEGENCQSITDVRYYVKEKKKLCDDCASKEECIGKAGKGRPNLYCEKHDGEEIKLYCKTHNVAVCQLCAMIDHRDMSCVRQEIEGAIVDSRAKLDILKEKAKDKLELCRVIGDQIHQCRKDTDTHLQTLKDEVDSVINEAIQTDKDTEKEDAAKINQEINEKNQKLQDEIKQINEKMQKNDEEREKRLELNHTDAEKRRELIDNKQYVLQTDIQNIAKEKERKIGQLEKSWQDNTKTTETTIQTLDTVLKDDSNVVKDGHHVKTSVSDELKKPLNEGEVKQITDTISGVRFVKGAGREKYDGRIDGYDGEWKLIDLINVSDKITVPAFVGYIDECNVIIRDTLNGSRHTYMLDMNTKDSHRVMTGSDASRVISCALLNDDKVVCGKYSKGCTGDSLTGCISVYDRQWERINDVTIPRNTTADGAAADVAVDQDGMIIAGGW